MVEMERSEQNRQVFWSQKQHKLVMSYIQRCEGKEKMAHFHIKEDSWFFFARATRKVVIALIEMGVGDGREVEEHGAGEGGIGKREA